MAQVDRPYPLFTAPGLKAWRRYLRQKYTVFVDESFERFLKMTEVDSRYGYFSYGGVGVPAPEYGGLKSDLATVLSDYLALVPAGEVEFKHAEFKRIPYGERRALAMRIREALWARGGFVSGFYTPSRSYVMERVRDAVMFEREEVPEDTTDLYRAGVQELEEMYFAKGQKSDLLAQLLLLPVSGWAHMLAFLKCPFRVIYDPREPDEDASVKEKIDGMREAMAILSPEVEGLFLGLEIDRKSEDEVGLQLADLMAGETREFFRAYPDMMVHGATRKIITQLSDEEFEAWDVAYPKGHPPLPNKIGAITKMPKKLAMRFLDDDPSGRTVLNCFAPLLTAGSITCFSSTGNPRHIMPFIRAVLDQSDR